MSEINDQNIKMEKKYCYLFHFCRKDTNLFFLQTLPDNILLTSKNIFSLKMKYFQDVQAFRCVLLCILKFQNNGQALKKLFLFKISIFLSNINLDRTTFHLLNTLFHHIYPLGAEAKAQISQYLCLICMRH